MVLSLLCYWLCAQNEPRWEAAACEERVLTRLRIREEQQGKISKERAAVVCLVRAFGCQRHDPSTGRREMNIGKTLFLELGSFVGKTLRVKLFLLQIRVSCFTLAWVFCSHVRGICSENLSVNNEFQAIRTKDFFGEIVVNLTFQLWSYLYKSATGIFNWVMQCI